MIDDELYLELNSEAASGFGLFKHGFFESDLSKTLNILKRLLAK
jgi:hypothetical protein